MSELAGIVLHWWSSSAALLAEDLANLADVHGQVVSVPPAAAQAVTDRASVGGKWLIRERGRYKGADPRPGALMRLSLAFTLTSLFAIAVAACGDDGGDADARCPTRHATSASTSRPPRSRRTWRRRRTIWMELGPADLSLPRHGRRRSGHHRSRSRSPRRCATSRAATRCPNAMVTVFRDQDTSVDVRHQDRRRANANLIVHDPDRHEALRLQDDVEPSALDTLLLNQTVDPEQRRRRR